MIGFREKKADNFSYRPTRRAYYAQTAQESIRISLRNTSSLFHLQKKSHTHNASDFATLINAALANNPNATFNLCISPYTTTPDEVAQLISILTGADSSYRLQYGLPEAPINIEYIELGNELEHMNDYNKSAEFSVWYGERIPAYIAAIEAAAPSVKIIANGMTCPWVGESSYNFWLDMITAVRTVNADTSYRIVDHIDAISFHPYYCYGNAGTDSLLDVAGNKKAYLDNKAPGNNVKFCITEHGTGWRRDDGVFGSRETSNFKSALINSASISMAVQRDYIEPALYNHGAYGNLWGRIDNSNLITPLGETYSFLQEEWNSNTLVDTTVSVTDDVVGTYQNYFTASTVQKSANEIKIILTNAADYRSVNTTFDLPSNYTLVNEKILTAPNPFTATFNANCEDLVTATSNDVEVENFSSYTVPASSIVVLTLNAPDGTTKFVENFDYANTSVTASDAAQTVATNANGAKWVTSATNNGYVAADYEITYEDTYGTASIANTALVIANTAVRDKATSVNWDISAVSEKPSAISEISFTVTGANGGVKLFTDANEASKLDFSNNAVGLSGTVNWTITIADGTLTWTATGTDTKSGTIAVKDADMTGYTYLASAYLNSGAAESASFDNFAFRYGASEEPVLEGITYVDNTSTIDITVNPSVYGMTSARVFVGYYDSYGVLVGVNTSLATVDGAVFNSTKPATSYATAKIFVWNNALQSPLAQAIPVQ